MQHIPANALPAAFEAAATLMQNRKFLEAEVLYNTILTQYPGHPESLHMLGVMAYSHLRFNEACTFMKESLQNNPSPPAHHLCNFAIALAEAERYTEAIPYFEQTLALDPGCTRAYGRLGHALQQVGRLEESLPWHLKGIKANPGYAEGYFFLGKTLQELGRREEALNAFHQALKARPESTIILHLLGNEFNQAGFNNEALSCYRSALAYKLNKKTTNQFRTEGNAYLKILCKDLGGRVLSVGSGTDCDKEGSLYREYFTNCASYFRLDFDNRHYPDITGDIQNLHGLIADQAYDVVFSIWALEHVPDVPAALAEIHRIVKHAGVFIFGLPLNRDFHSYPHDYHRFSLNGIRQLFDGRFRLEEVYTVGKELTFSLDPRLKLFGEPTPIAPAGFVGRARAM